MKRLILSLISIFSIVFASQAAPTTFTVNTNTDAGAGAGTTGDLRYCINQAAATAVGPHTIIFSTPMTITINSDLQINAGNHNGLTINGFVDGTNGPDVIIRSSGTFTFQMIFNNTVGANVYGLVFQNLDYGVHLNGATGCIVKGCYFGTDPTGTTIVNGIYEAGVYVQNGGTTANNIIGGVGTTLANGGATASNNSERCIFAGCSQRIDAGAGVRVPALLVRDAGGTQIINNYFGIDATGTVKLGNGNQTTKMPLAHSNIYMNDAINSLISLNVIAGATGSGIHMENWCNNTKIKGNYIGTNAAGTAAYNATTPSLSFGNEACGIFIQSGAGMVIGYDGGVIANERNIISGNGGAKHNNWQQNCDYGFNDYNQFGIYGESVGTATIKGNYIGTDVTGNASGTNNVFGNRAGGIKMVTVSGVGSSNSQNNIIGGGSTVNDRNVISGNGYLWKANDNTSTCNGGVANPSGMVGGPGILLQYAQTSANTISGNYVGLGADGLTALGNNMNGIEIQGAASNTIGAAGVPNYICNNTWGIFLQVDFGTPYVPAANNTIAGNVIGLTPTNTVLGNGVRADNTDGGGIGMQMGVNGTKIGTAVANGGNVISGNRLGISIMTNSVTAGATASNANILYNNIIGLDPTGTIAKPNTTYGISVTMGGIGTVFPFNNTIGGTGTNQPNIISGNQQSGILISNATAITAGTANTIVGNNIGTNLAGTADLGNTLQGIEIVNVSKTTITSNLISGNDQNGISLTGAGTNTIQNNIIGSNATKTAPIPNTGNGIYLTGGSASNIIGGVNASEPNTINNNGGNGVVVDGATSINNSIHKNSFSCNTGRGIVLSNSGNNSYAAPTIAGTPTQITWTGPAGSTIEVFETDGCATCPTSPTRLQGKVFVMSGASPFVFGAAQGFNSAKTYTAISHVVETTAAHNSSEFSQCYTLCQDPTSVSISTSTPTTFCSGGSVLLTATIGGGVLGTPTYVWKNGGTTIAGATSSTYSAIASGTYTVTYSSTQMCSAPMTSAGVTVTVNPNPTVTSVATGTVCSGVAQNYTITSSVASTYAWTRAVVSGISNTAGSGSSNPITETLTNTTTAAINVVYSIIPTSTTGSCAGAAFTYTVTVNPKPTIADQTPAAICSNNAFTVTPSGVPSGTLYTWTAPTITGGLTGGSAQATGQTSISQTLVNPGTAAGTAVYTVTPTSGTCSGSTFKVTVTVNPVATVTTVDPAAICSGATTAINLTSGTASSTYTWTIGTVNGVTGQSAGSGTSIAQTLTNSGTSAGTVQYIVTPTFGGCAGTAKTITVTVNPVATITTTDPAAICSGATTAISLTSGTGPVTYAWTIGTVTGTVTGQAAGNGTSIAQTLTNSGTDAATVQYLVTPTSGGCAGTAKTITVTINPVATVSNGDPAAICSGTTTSIVLASPSPFVSFAWTIGTVTGTVTGQSAGNASTIAQTLTNSGAGVATVQYIVTPTFGGCAGTAKTITVTVTPVATVTTATTASICTGQTTAITLTSGASPVTFAWTIGAVTGGVTGQTADNGSTIAQQLTNSGSAAGTVEYIVTPTSNGCTGTATSIIVTVNPKPAITSSASTNTCSDAALSYGITSNVSATYNWTRDVVTGISNPAGSGSTSPIAETLDNTTLSPVNVVYIITPTATSGSCAGDAFTLTVTVNPVPSVTSVPDQLICSGTSFSVSPSNVPNGTTYSWTAPTGSDFAGGGSGSGSTISQKLDNTTGGQSQATAVYTVTPSFAGCPGTSFTFNVNIDPVPSVSIDGNTPVCSGGTVTLTANITGSFVGTFEWFDVATGQSLATGTTYATSQEGEYTVKFTSTDGAACVGSPTTTTVVAYLPNNPPAVIVDSNMTTCYSYARLHAYYPHKKYPGYYYPNGASYGTWTVLTPPSPAATITTVLTDTVYNSIDVTGLVVGNTYTFVYTVTGDCGPDTKDTVTIKVGLTGLALTAQGPKDTLCITTARTLTAQATGGSGHYQYIWASADSSFTSIIQGTSISILPKDDSTKYYVVAVDVVNVGCKTNLDSIVIHAVKSQDLNVPNLMTPNGDHMNDIFYLADKVTHQPIIKEGSHVEIYNRWGSRVYEANDYDNTFDAKALTDGMYYYYISTPCGHKEYKSWLQILGNTNN
jgi:gliding motility-associated-like protein